MEFNKIQNQNVINNKLESGVTLIVLVITIIVLLILAGVSITGAVKGFEESSENVAISEIAIVQHAILERKTKASLTHEELPGTPIEVSQVEKYISDSKVATITLKATSDYKTLNKSQLESLGISNSQEEYIVNYQTGEVINYTDRKSVV